MESVLKRGGVFWGCALLLSVDLVKEIKKIKTIVSKLLVCMKTKRQGWRTKELWRGALVKGMHCWGIWYGKDTAISDRAWIIISFLHPIILPCDARLGAAAC